MQNGSNMGRFAEIAVYTGAALGVSTAIYLGAALAETNNNRDVTRCATALGSEATTAAMLPEACLPDEADELNGFTYHISRSQSGDSITTTAYYDIPSVDEYLREAVTPDDENFIYPFAAKELAFYATISAIGVFGASRVVKNRRADKAEAFSLATVS